HHICILLYLTECMDLLDSAGHVIDLVKDKLPEMQLSEEDRQRNLELLEQAKKVHGSGRLAVDWKPTEKRKVSSGTLTPRFTIPKENCESKSPPGSNKSEDGGRNSNQAPATGVAKPVPRPPTQQAPCTAEIKTIGAFPPLMRAVSWDAIGGINSRNGAEDTSSDKARDSIFKPPGLKELPAPKLSKFREEHKLMRNQTIVGSKLPDLSEAAEQEKGPASSPNSSPRSEETKSDAMPNISDIMLRKLKLHRGLPGCPPPLTEKEVENAFVQLSLAFRNDNYTLETRLKQAERERNLTEEDTQKELEEFKMTSPQWQNLEQREAYQRLIDTLAVLHRLATRLSSRSEIVGAVRQEKRMSKATEVMMQYVENLKRTYEKDHAELTEFKKLANQNSNRCYGGSVEAGVSRASRSMSLTLGKALPRRRVSVAVVPKFNLLNIPGQTPPTATAQNVPTASTPGAALPALVSLSFPALNQVGLIILFALPARTYKKKTFLGYFFLLHRRMEEILLLLSRIRPKISWSKRLLWMALMVFLVMCLVISIFTFFSGYNKRDDT
uniref:Inositol 1,4,5-triphosphate receptor associated 1 n=1 Tax=Hippocampus comes TaxID=109280 RepID=A0A3Q2XB24_HIPCM